MKFFIAQRLLRSQKNTGFISVISKISIIGIILGVAMLITVLSVMNGFEHELRSKILSFTSHITIYDKKNDSVAFNKVKEQIILSENIQGIAPYIQREGLVTSSNNTASVLIRAIDPESERNVSAVSDNIIMGRYKDFNKNENGIIVGVGVANKLLISVGDEIKLFSQIRSTNSSQVLNLNKKFKVIGIYDIGLYEYNNSFVFINLNTITEVFQGKNNLSIDAFRVKLKKPLSAPYVNADLSKKYNNIFVQDWTQTHISLFTAINNEKRVMFIILTLIIAVAAFNIISSLLMLVVNKEKDIAILMTLGAFKTTIIMIFVIQGLLLGVTGIVLGVILGLILSHNIDVIIRSIESFFQINLLPAEVYHLSEIPAIINYTDILWIIGITFLLSLVSTIYPALKASNILPSKVFRTSN
ncbi:MAG: lipoprotein-releasing system transmembrane subunit LolC [Gammaproteobacteria bacterium]|nr:lipoprotein-releasing system transmembrane subunit LolC [Gammaproteobacteria bacterium]